MKPQIFFRVERLLLCLMLTVCWSLALSSQANWTVEKLPAEINTIYDEIAPVPTRNGRTLFFTRVGSPDFDRTLIFDTIKYHLKLDSVRYMDMLGKLYGELGQTVWGAPWRSAFNQDVWLIEVDSSGKFGPLTHPEYPLNSALPNSLVAITPDPNAFYVINQFKPEGDMKRGFSVVQRQADQQWSFPKPIEIKDFYTITSDVNLTMSFDGKILIISASRFDSRDLDLYICFKEGNNRWSAPRNLGAAINSDRREITPFLAEDNRTLYFASNRYGTGSNLDLFMVRREGDSWWEWSAPYQLIPPINSSADESQPYFNMSSGQLYFTSKRDGNSDIFRVQIAPPQPTEIEVRGRIINRSTGMPVKDATLWYGASGASLSSLPAANGTFVLRIPKGVTFQLVGQKAEFNGLPDSILFRSDYYYFMDYYTLDLYVEPLQKGSTIALQPIFFQQSKAIILEESFGELERLAQLLTLTPSLHIRIEGHTDNVGRIEDLMQLSQERADAVKAFLIERGIAASRLNTVGHGPKIPLDENSTEYQRQRNRRVQVIVE
jgi:outer membrane protein OmpA-like peptidoglycan-associated protein